ncbi:methyl-coenzyme M reductase-associated protein Mmp3 [Methanocaldococcus indicus]|uniref:methyl-coenzyme M reductase-associated protein Mmp3 n=1 Tax=Methanocaldococcus indicus TaxID=213231 RepID=UPI003C6D6D8A
MAKVKINNKEKEGKYLRDVVKGEFYKEGANIVIIKGIKKESEEGRRFLIKTNKGNITIAITEDNETANFFLNNYKNFVKKLRWVSGVDIAFGPTRIDLEISDEEKKFEKWDVLLSLSGLDIDEGHLIFITKKTSGIYGLKEPKIGRVVGGKWVLSNLELGDYIIDIEPIREEKEAVDYITTTNLDLELEDGWEIYTYFTAEFDGPAESVEHCLAVMEDNIFEVSDSTNTYIADSRLQTLKIEEGNLIDRDRGTITVRNFGVGEGKVYIYKESRTSSLSHTVVGKVKEGLELVDFSDSGILTVKTIPERLCVIGLELDEALEKLKKYNIEVDVEGNGIVVEQEPKYTLDVLKTKKVKLKCLDKSKILVIELYEDKAPITSWYFRKTTGLTTIRVGKLHVYFKHKDVVMFKGNPEYAKGLLPENTPKDVVKAYEIGVTNMVSRYKGMIGVRLSDSDKFGPTGESFEKTNIVGRVVENYEILNKVRTGDEVYILLKK